MEETIKKLDDLRKECLARAEEATSAILALEAQRESLCEMAKSIDHLVMDFYKK